MLNEWEEFLQYIASMAYAAVSKRDSAYLGRFTFDTLMDFEGLSRVLTIIARGYLFHQLDGTLAEEPRNRIEHVRRALCAWCSIPDEKTAAPKAEWQLLTDFRDLHEVFPELVGEDGNGWFCRHVRNVVGFVEAHPDRVSKSAWDKCQKLRKGFDAVWRKKVRQFQVPLFSPGTKGQWVLRFDDVLADALEAGPLRQDTVEIPKELTNRIRTILPSEVPIDVVCTLIAYYAANKPEDSDWVVLPVANFDAYFGSTSFGRKYLKRIPEEILERSDAGFGVCRYRVAAGCQLSLAGESAFHCLH